MTHICTKIQLVISTYNIGIRYKVRVQTINKNSNILLPTDPSTSRYPNEIRMYYVCVSENTTQEKSKRQKISAKQCRLIYRITYSC